MASRYTKWKFLAQPSKRGHRYFEHDATGRIAVADDSGEWPPDTDDGIIWLEAKAATVERDRKVYAAPRVRLAAGGWIIVTFLDLCWMFDRGILFAGDIQIRHKRGALQASSTQGLARLRGLIDA